MKPTMKTTIQLLDYALSTGISQRELSRRLHLSPSALAVARIHGRISVETAVRLAVEIGEDPGRWALIALAEADGKTQWASQLKRVAEAAKAWLSELPGRRLGRP